MASQALKSATSTVNRVRQRGAFSVLAASAMVVSLTMVALAVDSGRLFYQQGQVQGAADAAAVAAVSTYAEGENAGDPAAALAAAEDAADGSLDEVDDVSLSFGRVESEDGRLVFHQDDEGMAIQVDIGQRTPMSMVAGWIWPDDARLTGEATAEQPRLIALQAGTGVASLDSQESELLDLLFSGLLGTDLELDIASYQGLADTRIRLMDLVEVSGHSGVEELLEANVSLGEFIDLVARAAPGGSQAELILGPLSSQVSTQLDFRVGDLLQVGVGNEEAALSVALDAFSLLQLGALAANGDQAVALDLSGDDGLLEGLGLAEIDVQLNVGETPQIAIGQGGQDPSGEWRTEVNTGQVGLETELSLGSLLGDLLAADLRAEIDLGSGQARAERPYYESRELYVDVEGESSLTEVVLESELTIAGIGSEPVSGSGSLSGDRESLTFGPEFGVEHSQSMGVPVGQALGDALDDLEMDILGLSVDGIAEIIVPVVEDLGEIVIDPILAGLGLQTGIAEVSVNEVRVGSPQLVQ